MDMSGKVILKVAEARRLATKACLNTGADEASARSLVNATLSASLYGSATLGFPHLVDYLNSFREGRISGHPNTAIDRTYPAFLTSNADRGIAQLGFDLAFDAFVDATQNYGIAVFTQTNSYTAGELGYYPRRLASAGIASIAATNANAMVVAKPGGPAVYSTNPMAFGFPLGEDSPPLIVDQASSATAFVNIVAAAEAGQSIPVGWAVDKNGADTEDAIRALNGALLPFGGRKGANVALIVEMLSAGLSGGPWSLDTADFRSGSNSPAIGLTIIAVMPGPIGGDRITRARQQVERLAENGVFIPGVTGVRYPRPASDQVTIQRAVYDNIRKFAGELEVVDTCLDGEAPKLFAVSVHNK